MELNMNPTFEKNEWINNQNQDITIVLLTINCKIMTALYNQETTKQNIYKNILDRQRGMGYSPSTLFEKSIINSYEVR